MCSPYLDCSTRSARPSDSAMMLSRLFRALRIGVFAVAATSVAAAQTIGVNAGTTTSVAVASGGKVTVPIVVNLANAGTLDIAALQSTVTWNPAVLSFDSVRVVAALGWSFTTNTANTATGSLTFNASNSSSLATTATLANVFFTSNPSGGGTRVVLTPTAAGNAASNSILPAIRPLSQDVCVGTLVKWGDVNASGAVDILDAQQVTRFAAGLSVANATAMAQRGDVNGSNTVDIIDAQQIARFAVGLSAAARINVDFVPVAAPTGVVITPAGPQAIPVGTSSQLVGTPSAGATNLTGCAPVTWATSDATVVTVNASGFATGVGAGSANITATSQGIIGTTAVSVTVVPVALVTVNFAAPAIQVGTTTAGTATVFDAANNVLTGRPISWSSSNTSVATVNASTGVITGVAAGTATIFATAGGITGQKVVFVTAGAPATTVTVALGSNAILTAQTTTATATARDAANAVIVGAPIAWSSSNTAVATVNASTGVVTGVAPGTANIVATTNGVTGFAVVTVSPAPVATVTVNPGAVQIGGTVQAVATARDAGNNLIPGTTFSWTSSDPTIATVNANTGLVTGVALGSVTIFATAGGTTGSATFTVQAQAPVATVTVTLASSIIQVSTQTTATATARDASNNVVTGSAVAWLSSNPSVATVTPATGVITAVALGTTTISATVQGVTGQAVLTVGAPVATVNVSLGQSSVQAGSGFTATATTLDLASNVLNGRVIAWNSTNTAVATVNASTGAVNAVAPGTTNIVATSEGVTGQASLTVVPVPAASVTVALGLSSIQAGTTTSSTATVRDANNNVLAGAAVAWSSSNTAVATVNATTGTVTAVSAGTANIIGTSGTVNGQASLTVTQVPVASVIVTLSSQAILVAGASTATAVTKDASGNVLTGRVIAWSSSNTGVATVNASTGAVTGVGAGSANVVATSEGIPGQLALTVSVATSQEPAGMTFIDERPFNCAKPSACESNWQYSETYANGLAVVQDATAPRSASNVGQQLYTSALPGGSSPAIAARAFTPKKTLYVSMWMMLSSNWVGHPTGTNKITHFFITGYNRIYTMARGTGTNALKPAFGLQNLAAPYFDGVSQTATSVNILPNVTNVPIVRGQWQRWEVVLTGNTPGVADGTIEMWIDGVKTHQYVNVMFDTAAQSGKFDTVAWSPTWGGGGGTITTPFFMNMDAMYISVK